MRNVIVKFHKYKFYQYNCYFSFLMKILDFGITFDNKKYCYFGVKDINYFFRWVDDGK